RRLRVKGFNDLGLRCTEPEGAFYCFPNISSTGLSSDEFCEKLLSTEKIALVPGNAFGASGEGFVRASYAYSADHIKKALDGVKRFLDRLYGTGCEANLQPDPGPILTGKSMILTGSQPDPDQVKAGSLRI
ncbi:MAG: aminotransferase class I/II-fold pyridoxal phosphate-dependent enzyme, partial [Clostridia bacterium]|nr:aminotransferase class I/II-fold pyridoxal phosphate-dependent enzyme [Clostridia bacterium]